MAKVGIDIARCREAMRDISVQGCPDEGDSAYRHTKIAEAISLIQENGEEALLKRYLGIKNYAAFGDQGEDHPYGFGPKHGSIVFRIGRTDTARRSSPPATLGKDHVYLLECVRDFASIEDPTRGIQRWNNTRPRINLCEVIRLADHHGNIFEQLSEAVENATIESHEEVSA